MKQLSDLGFEGQNDITDGELLDDVVGKYRDKNEEELMSELKKAVKAAKEDGTFNEQSIENFADLVSPYLSDEQKEKLSGLISVIKCDE